MRRIPAVLILSFPLVALCATEPSFSPGTGHWEGTIKIANKIIQVNADLAQNENGGWTGTMGFPGLRLSDVPVAQISVKNGSVHFENRDSLFGIDATLSPDGRDIEGDFESACLLRVPVPIRLHRISSPSINEPVQSMAVSESLEGAWEGVIKFGPSWEDGDSRANSSAVARFVFHNTPDGGAIGVFQRPETDQLDLAITAIQETADGFSFEVKGTGGSFRGALKDQQLTGEWMEFDLDPVPLVLSRAR